MTRRELEDMARAMNLPIEEVAASMGESSVLRGSPPFRQFNPSQQTEKSLRAPQQAPPIVPGKLG
jgi:hypothetical protein